MAEVTNAFLKSKMNQDLDARILPKGEYRRALNLQISRSEGSTVGEFEQIPGATKLVDSLDGVGNVDLGIIGTYVVNHSLHVTGNVAVSGLSAIGGASAPIRFASLPNDNADKAEINALKAGDLYVALSGDHNGYVCVKK